MDNDLSQQCRRKPPLGTVLWHHLMEQGIRLRQVSETPAKCIYETILNIEGHEVTGVFSTMESWKYVHGDIIFPNAPPEDKVIETIRFLNRLNGVLRLGRFYFDEKRQKAHYEAMVYCREARRRHSQIMGFLVGVCTDSVSLALPSYRDVIEGKHGWQRAAQTAIDKTRAYDGS